MKAHIYDRDALSAVAVRSLHAYLRQHGWTRIEAFGDKGIVYGTLEKIEVIVPESTAYADYAQSVGKILTILADLENRSETSILRDLTIADLDLIRVRAPEANDDGSLPIDKGVDLIKQSREALLAAACAVSRPQRVFRAGSNQEAKSYLESVRLGQTERGSFVVSLLSPVPPSLAETEGSGQMTLWPEIAAEPYQRRVTRTLMTALSEMKSAISKVDGGQGISAFDDRVVKGISSNLCAAVASLIRDGEGIDVSTSWALTRPGPQAMHRVSFVPDDAATLEEAARELKNREPRSDERLEGPVIRLARGPSAEEGQVTIQARIDDKPTSIRVDFGPSDYTQIVTAHSERKVVSLVGDLDREGSRWILKNPRSLEIIQPDDDEH